MRFVFVTVPFSHLQPRLFHRSLTLLSFFLLVAPALAAPEWASLLSQQPRGPFPELRPAHAIYSFGWSGITAATAEISLLRPSPDMSVLEAHGRTVGLARALWGFDVTYRSVVDAKSAFPVETHQDETARGKRVVTDLKFSRAGVTRTRAEAQRPMTTKWFGLPDLHDLDSAIFYLRSQPLRQNEVYRLAVYPTSSAYLATATVLDRRPVHVPAGSYSAIRLDLKLQRIGKKGKLEPHRKFKRATAWISDDSDRLPLRIDAEIFIGTVTAELESVRFD